jgi:LemA protein
LLIIDKLRQSCLLKNEVVGMLGWIITGIVVIIVLVFVLTYNRFVVLRNRIENAFAQIDVQLKRRADLIPNLIEVVKGYAKHEKKVFTDVTEARSAVLKAQTIPEKAKADNMMTAALKSVFAVAEAYPKLEASENFRMLQEELSGTESKIAYSRQAYNDSVLSYNNGIEMFPGNVIAGMFTFKPKDMFKAEEAEKAAVKVSFDAPEEKAVAPAGGPAEEATAPKKVSAAPKKAAKAKGKKR